MSVREFNKDIRDNYKWLWNEYDNDFDRNSYIACKFMNDLAASLGIGSPVEVEHVNRKYKNPKMFQLFGCYDGGVLRATFLWVVDGKVVKSGSHVELHDRELETTKIVFNKHSV